LTKPSVLGKDLFNAAFFLYEQKIVSVIHKTLLPTYDVLMNTIFEPAKQWQVVPFKGKKLAITICEDIWNLGDNPLYTICPMGELMEQQPDIMLNISASPFDYTHDEQKVGNKSECAQIVPVLLQCSWKSNRNCFRWCLPGV
jgi:NAD+ synthase (glutamine-hydrolysing)